MENEGRKNFLQLSTEQLGYRRHANFQTRRVRTAVSDQSWHRAGVGPADVADRRAGEEGDHPGQVSGGDPPGAEQGRLPREQAGQGRGLLHQEADEQDQDRRRGAADRRTARANLVRQRHGLRAVLVPGRGALRAAAVDGGRAQRDLQHPRPVHVGGHRRGHAAQDSARQGAVAVRGGKTMRLILLLLFAAISARAETVIRVGHFPNVTHAQGVIAHRSGWFEKKLGPDVKIQWFIYNAGPSAMEAIFADSIDLTYVGPSPALNAYSKSRGDEVRIVAGAANGGAGLVVQPDGRIKAPGDFRGQKVATPQLGNTQDVACRAWLAAQGFKVTQLGGDVLVLPTANPDQLNLFKQQQVDAVWTVEPWVSRLEMESGAKVFVEEKDTITTVLTSSAKFLRDHRDLARKFTQAHAELTEWIQKHPDEAQKIVREELSAETTRQIPAELIARSWKRQIGRA